MIRLLISFALVPLLTASCSQTHQEPAPPREQFTIVEEPPSYEGGFEAFYGDLMRNLRYPLDARRAGVEGQVDVQFVIERDGQISNGEILNGIGHGCDEEVLRVLQSANAFRPAAQRGRRVRVRMHLPITFKLQPGKSNPDGSTQGAIIVGEASTNQGSLQVDASYADGVWTGIVRSPEGEPLPGANVILKETVYGTVSDLDGTFRLEAEPHQQVVISFVGFDQLKLGQQ